MVHPLEGEDTFDTGDVNDRRQPLQHRVSPVKSVSMVHSLEGEDTFDMGEATDRRQPLHNRVSPLRASQWCILSKVKIHLIWVKLLIAVNRYTIVSPLRASQWCTFEGEDTFDMGDGSTDRRQPLHYRVSPVKSVSMVNPLEGEDTFDMGDATDQHQPLHYRVSPLRASQWCTLSKVKIHLIWVKLLIAVNRYTIVCLR